VEAATPISIKTGMAMVAPKAVGTLASTAGANVCVICVREENCNDCDDIEASVLVDLVLLFKTLSLRKCMHKNADFL